MNEPLLLFFIRYIVVTIGAKLVALTHEHFWKYPFCVIPIEKLLSNRDSIRKAREAFLIQKGRTIDPDGLNIREETY